MTEPATAAGRPRKAADSARWCERCQKWGDHHTDRHDECAPATAADRSAASWNYVDWPEGGHQPPASVRRAWEWRKAWGGFTLASDYGEHGRLFHAYDVNDLAACEPVFGLVRTCEPVNEGSHLCPDCMTIVRRQPQGRPKRERVDA